MAFIRIWRDFHDSLKRILTKDDSMSEEQAESVLKTLRKYSSLDMVVEFAKQAETQTKQRHYVAGYFDALDDLARFIKTRDEE